MIARSHIPNAMTAARLALTPALAVLFVLDAPWCRYAALALILVCELTDALDGYLARKWQVVSDWGKLMDPTADRIYRDTVFICLVAIQEASVLLVLPMLFRDHLVYTLRSVCAHRGIILAARSSGKFKAIFQAGAIILIAILRIAALNNTWVQSNLVLIVNSLLAIACILSVYSGLEYIRAIAPSLKTSHKD